MIKKIQNIIFAIVINILDNQVKKKILFFFKKKKINNIIVLDIGAHKGETIDFFINNFKVKKIFSFEPNPELFKNLEEKKSDLIEVYNLGVGKKSETKVLNVYDDTFSSSYKKLDKKSSYFKRKNKFSFSNYKPKKIKTKVVCLDEFFIDKKIKIIDILKIDTEGNEFDILLGLKKKNYKKIKFIYLEHHYNNMLLKKYNFTKLNKLLNENNFFISEKIRMPFRKGFEYIYSNRNLK